jgi:hypothetical protein
VGEAHTQGKSRVTDKGLPKHQRQSQKLLCCRCFCLYVSPGESGRSGGVWRKSVPVLSPPNSRVSLLAPALPGRLL